MEISLGGRYALITGGSKGLGFATAQRLARSGANVAILARRLPVVEEAVETIRQDAKGKVFGLSCDVSRLEDTEAAYRAVMQEFGQVDILVNNAGQSRLAAFETITDELWREDYDQKVMAAIRMTRLVWPQMKERRWGRVINVLGTNAKHYRPNGAPTAISRAAGLALTKVLAGEGAPHNVLVNAVMVGSIVSDQIVRAHQANEEGKTLDEMIDELGRTIPIGRMGEAEEFANMICFLVSDAGSYVTGAAIPVDGGRGPFI